MSTTETVVCQQFLIPGALEEIKAAPSLQDVFAPPYHGPRNVPISVQLPEESEEGPFFYTHFPIVQSGRYAIYVDTANVFDALVYSGCNQKNGTGTEIDVSQKNLEKWHDEFKECFVSTGEIIFTQNDPQPIAIRWLKNNGNAAQTVRYIVSQYDDSAQPNPPKTSFSINISKVDNELYVLAVSGGASYQLCHIQSGNSHAVDVKVDVESGNYIQPNTLNGVFSDLRKNTTVNIPQGTYYLIFIGIDWGGGRQISLTIRDADRVERIYSSGPYEPGPYPTPAVFYDKHTTVTYSVI